MNIQIVGTRKCADTRKAERFFKERGHKAQFVDLNERGLSAGELENISRFTGAEALLDRDSKAYNRRGLAYMEFDILEELLRTPLLLKTPVVRCGREVTVGYEPDRWQTWLDRNE
jgi:arsenate reductase